MEQVSVPAGAGHELASGATEPTIKSLLRTEWLQHATALALLLIAACAFTLWVDPDALPGPDVVMIILLLAVIAIVAVSALRRWRTLSYNLSTPMDLPTWSFGSSWAANLTAVGALFGTVLSSTLKLPTTPLLSKDAYTGLFLFFGAVVIVAGFFYTATRASDKAQANVYHGYILTFLIACALTVWAVLGELWVLLLLLFDLHATGAAFTDIVFAMFRLTIGATIGLTIWYCWRTIGATIYWTMKPEKRVQKQGGTELPAPLARPSSTALM
jgi:hypothetical protein